jgi:hypothetical protein
VIGNVGSSTNPQTGMQDPAEQIGFQNPNTTNEGCSFNGTASNGQGFNVYQILIQNVNNAAAVRTFNMLIPNPTDSLVFFASTGEDSLQGFTNIYPPQSVQSCVSGGNLAASHEIRCSGRRKW